MALPAHPARQGAGPPCRGRASQGTLVGYELVASCRHHSMNWWHAV
jgi:hypothetical protein